MKELSLSKLSLIVLIGFHTLPGNVERIGKDNGHLVYSSQVSSEDGESNGIET